MLLRAAVILMLPTMACIGYYAMAGSGNVAAGMARVAGVALGLISLLAMAMALWATKANGKMLIFWVVVFLLALSLILSSV